MPPYSVLEFVRKYTETKLCLATLAPTEYYRTNRLNITDFRRGHDTTDNGSTEAQLILNLYTSKKRYNI